MPQLTPSGLHLPLLLVTDSGNSDTAMQTLLQPVIQLLASEASEQAPQTVTAQLQPIDSGASAQMKLLTGPGAMIESGRGRSPMDVVNYAQTAQVGLVAVAYHDRVGMRDLLTGLSTGIARYATCPVLVMRGSFADRQQEPGWSRVLLVVNSSEATRQAIAITRQLIPIGIRQVTILCIQSPLNTRYLYGPFATPTPNWQLNQSLQQAQREQSQYIVQHAQTSLQTFNLEIQTLVQTSEPGPLICQVAHHTQSNVIIMGSDAAKRFSLAGYHPGFRPTRLTVTGEYVMHHAPCPIFFCRAALPAATDKVFSLPKVRLQAPGISRTR